VGNSTIAGIPQPPGGIVASVLPWNIPKTVICLQLSAFCKSPVRTFGLHHLEIELDIHLGDFHIIIGA
jgi:hypothetical protein